MLKKKFSLFFVLSLLLLSFGFWLPSAVKAEGETCLVYFTGVGCSHCAQTDPVVLQELLASYPHLVVIEYEIYQTSGNAQVFDRYATTYQLPSWKKGIPLVFLENSQEGILVGDSPIVGSLEKKISEGSRPCLLADGSTADFSNLNLDELPGFPKVWRQNSILIKEAAGEWIFAWDGSPEPEKNLSDPNPSAALSSLMKGGSPSSALSSLNYETLAGPRKVPLSGQTATFGQIVKLRTDSQLTAEETPVSPLTLTKVFSLALVDAVNPCALAVLLLMLTAIMAHNLQRKKNILLAGFAFIASIFIIYFFYGLVIIKFFQVVQALSAVKLWLYRSLGILAALLGLLNLKDAIRYRPGGLGTEMPLFLRPKAKKFLSRVTSPRGAFITGALVTFFLLPCTIGPYFIAGGVLSTLETLKIVPWLLFYNLIFVLPMVIIVAIVYAGFGQAKDVSQWKEKNIRKIHLVEGLIMLVMGICLFFGLI